MRGKRVHSGAAHDFNLTWESLMPNENTNIANQSRREMFRLAGAGIGVAALSASGLVRAQLPEEANTEALEIVRKGIDKHIRVYNVDLLEAEAKKKYSEGVYVFVANGSGEQWTLRENRRAFNDYVFTPHRMQASCATRSILRFRCALRQLQDRQRQRVQD